VVSGTTPKVAGETVTVSVSEATTKAISLARTDAGAVSVVEAVDFATVEVDAVDDSDISVTENTHTNKPKTAAETISVSVTEAGTVVSHETLSNFESTDILTITVGEKGAVYRKGKDRKPIRFDSNTSHGTIIETDTEPGVRFGTSGKKGTRID
jgi:hypothetical protein